jgi:hypothetical protein
VTIFSVPSVPVNINCATDILETNSISMHRIPKLCQVSQKSNSFIKMVRLSPLVLWPIVPTLMTDVYAALVEL